LETERLRARDIWAYDLDGLLEIWGAPEAGPHFPRTLDHQAMREWIERNQRCYEQYGHASGRRLCWENRNSLAIVGWLFRRLTGSKYWRSAITSTKFWRD
jgi:hypothetical protein